MIFTPPRIGPPCVSNAVYTVLSAGIRLAEFRARVLDAALGWLVA